MKESFIYTRNLIIRFFYKAIFRRVFFMAAAETMHTWMLIFGRFLGSNVLTRKVTTLLFSYSNKSLEQKIAGIRFPNPIGLAAGYDKDAVLTDILPAVGFGHVEIGSVTGEPCKGNPRPRLWRLEKSKGLVVYYGLKNEGCERVAQRLGKKNFKIPLGTNIAKTNSKETVEIEAGINDYVKAYREFTNVGSYFAINISCPNTFGGQPFTNAGGLEKLLAKIDKIPTKKPTFLKISPDLNKREIDQIVEVSRRYKVVGFICTNLTEDRKKLKIADEHVPRKGSISGKAVEQMANEIISYVYRKTRGEFVIIGCGGVFSAEDAYRKIRLGASLVQLLTGMIFEGPQLISEINQGLIKLLEKDGFNNISQAVGVENKHD